MTEAKDGYGYIMPHFDTVTGLPFANEQLYFPHELSAWAPRMTHKGGYEAACASLAPHARSLRVLAITTQGMVALTSDGSTPRRAADIGPAVEEGLILPALRVSSQSLTLKKIGGRLLKELTHPQPLASFRQILSGSLFGMRQRSSKLLTAHHARVP